MQNLNDEEQWRPVVGYPSYEVSTFGRIRSLGRGWRKRNGVTYLKPAHRGGYLGVTLYRDGDRRKDHSVHILVLLAFVGPKPQGEQACHHDDNSNNNRLDNLRWGTPASNYDDRKRNGGNLEGSRNAQAKLTEADAGRILKRCLAGERYADISRGEGICQSVVESIAHGDRWKHISGRRLEKQPQVRRGAQHHAAKLTDSQVLEIKSLAASTPTTVIAKQYSVAKETVRRIVRGKGWTHLFAPEAIQACAGQKGGG